MFSLVKDIDVIKVNADDVCTELFKGNVVTDVSLTLDLPENRLTDLVYLCHVRESAEDKCIPCDIMFSRVVHGFVNAGNSVPPTLRFPCSCVTFEQFESIRIALGLYRHGANCNGWSSRAFITRRGSKDVSDNV